MRVKNQDLVNESFKDHLKSLKEIYEQSTLKERHRLNEHIKNFLLSHGSKTNKDIEEYLE